MTKPVSVLVLDDEKEFLSSIELLFAAEPYAIFTTTHPFEALGILSREVIKVIICDQRMPMVSGTNFLQEVRENFPGTIRILLTGHADMQSAEEAVNKGQVFAFFSKPCAPDTLIAAVRKGIELFDKSPAERKTDRYLRAGKAELSPILAGAKSDIDRLLQGDDGALTAGQRQTVARLAERMEIISRLSQGS